MKSDMILSKMLETDLASDAPSTNVEEKVIEEVKNLETQVALYQANLNRLKKENEELRQKLANDGK